MGSPPGAHQTRKIKPRSNTGRMRDEVKANGGTTTKLRKPHPKSSRRNPGRPKPGTDVEIKTDLVRCRVAVLKLSLSFIQCLRRTCSEREQPYHGRKKRIAHPCRSNEHGLRDDPSLRPVLWFSSGNRTGDGGERGGGRTAVEGNHDGEILLIYDNV